MSPVRSVTRSKPTGSICDGGSGVLAAVAASWPDTRIWRCLVHVQRNVRTYRTTRPRTEADPIEEPVGAAEHNTGLNAEEGLWLRRSWAGRN